MKVLVLAVILLACAGGVQAAPVNINKAEAQVIADSLSGIGIKKAEAIVAYRAKVGAFKSADDLANVPGICEKTIEKNRKDILLDGAPAAPAAEDNKKK